MSTSVVSALIKFGETLNDQSVDEKSKLRVLNTLTEVTLTLRELSESGVGRAVRKLKGEAGVLGRTAQTLLMKWKNLLNDYIAKESVSLCLPPENKTKSVDNNGVITSTVPVKPHVSRTKLSSHSANVKSVLSTSPKSASCSHSHSPVVTTDPQNSEASPSDSNIKVSKKRKSQTAIDSVDSSSGLSFMESLNMGSNIRQSRNKKKRSDQSANSNIPSLGVPIPKPSTSFNAEILSSLSEPVTRPDAITAEDTNSHLAETPDDVAFQKGELKFKSKKVMWVPKQNKAVVSQLCKDVNNSNGLFEVPSLINLCVDVLERHVHYIDHLGHVPYELIARVLRSASVDDLTRIERLNPQYAGLSDDLWRKHVQRDFQHIPHSQPKSNETWCKFYHRLRKEEADRLDRIVQSARRVKEVREISARRTAITTEVIAPRQIQRLAARHLMNNHVHKRPMETMKPRNMSYPTEGTTTTSPTPTTMVNKSVTNLNANRGNLLNKLRRQFRSGYLR